MQVLTPTDAPQQVVRKGTVSGAAASHPRRATQESGDSRKEIPNR